MRSMGYTLGVIVEHADRFAADHGLVPELAAALHLLDLLPPG